MEETIQQLIDIKVENATLKEQIKCAEIVEKIQSHCAPCNCLPGADYISKDEAILLIFNQ